jgi:TatD DNase family protein
MIDTHAHLDFKEFDKDRDKVIAHFFNQGGKFIVTVGVNKKRNERALSIAQKDERIFATLAYHPEETNKIKPLEAVAGLKKFLKDKRYKDKIVAVGEIGLDYFHDNKNKIRQQELFESQLKVASAYALPVIIHCREAYEDVYRIIMHHQSTLNKIVIHCYQGNLKWTKKFLSIPNLFFSFTGNITFEKESEAEIFKVTNIIPLERIMAETDCPFLAPVPYRGKRNEPSYVKEVIKKIANVKNINIEAVEQQTDKNAIEFFNLNKQ